MDRKSETQKEIEKLNEIFKDVEPGTQKLISGLVEETAYLKVELLEMREILEETGMIKVHPTDKSKQKALPVANEYRRTMNVYALNIKVLNAILNRSGGEEDDDFDNWYKEKMKDKELRKQELQSKGV